MKFSRFAKSNAGFVAALAVSGLLTACVLKVSGVSGVAVLLVVSMQWICMLAWFILKFVRERALARELGRIARSESPLKDATGLPQAFDEESAAALDAVEAVAQDAAKRLAEARSEADEQRRYMQAWVREVKTPIATADLILENNPGGAAPELREELERIDGYVEQALYFSKARSEEKDCSVRPVDVRTFVNDAVKSRERMLVAAHVRMDVGNVDDTVLTDEKWMRFALGQLLDNAVKYRSPDRVQEVRIWGERLDEGGARDRYVLHVQDAGRGVPEPDLGRVFDPGFTGSNGRDADVRASTGMGLYIVKTLCDKLGVGIHVASDSVSYTGFELAFPMNMMHHVERAG